jgi:outer membrane protein assembly factor BamA
MIVFPGIASFSRADLLTVMATEKPTWMRRYVRLGSRTNFWADDFAADILRIQNFYRREGFPQAVVRGSIEPREKHEELRLKLEISEGEPLILEHWFISMGSDSGAGVDSARWAPRMPIRIGKRLSRSAATVSADTLRYRLQEIGHARARVEYIIHADSLRNTATLEFVLFPGSFCYFGVTHIRGLKQIAEGSARRELRYHELDPYAPSKLAATRRRLLRLETFRMVRTEVDLDDPSDTLTVWIHTEEGNRYKVRTGGGYDTEERMHLQAEFTDLNFFGRARRFSMLARVSEINRIIEGRLFWPHTPWNATDITWIPGWRLETRPGFVVEEKTMTTILSAEPLPKVTTALSNEVGRELVRDSSETTLSIETISMAWDTRDNPLIPSQGHVLSLSASESGAVYRTSNRWWRLRLQGRTFVPIDQFTTFATKAESGFMGPLHDSDLTPINERFYLGGASTVRGWGQDRLSPRNPEDSGKPVGGDFTYHITAEIRRDIWGPVGLILFVDAGNVWEDFASAAPLDLYTAGGLGIRFLTPVGPIRVDCGYQLRANPYNENRVAFHLSLGSPF